MDPNAQGIEGTPTGEVPNGTPVEDPKPGVQDPNQEGDDPSKKVEGQDQDQPKQPSKGVQTRIDELTKARRAAEREAEYWKRVAEGQAPAQEPAKAAANEKPNKESFESYDEYVEALATWRAREIIAQNEQERSKRTVEETRQTTWTERLKATRVEIPDFDEVVGGSEVPINPHVAEELSDSEHGPALAYHFAKNPEVLEHMNGLSPKEATRAIAKLEAALFSKKEAPAPEPKPVSKAPVPVAPIRGNAATIPTPGKMSMDEYVAMRKKQGASWAR